MNTNAQNAIYSVKALYEQLEQYESDAKEALKELDIHPDKGYTRPSDSDIRKLLRSQSMMRKALIEARSKINEAIGQWNNENPTTKNLNLGNVLAEIRDLVFMEKCGSG